MFLYTADGFIRGNALSSGGGNPEGYEDENAEDRENDVPYCDEGELCWIPEDEISGLELWEGDRIFLEMIKNGSPFFSLKLMYDEYGELINAKFD